MDTYDKTINGVKYTLFVPQRDCYNEMGKPYSRTINDIAIRKVTLKTVMIMINGLLLYKKCLIIITMK